MVGGRVILRLLIVGRIVDSDATDAVSESVFRGYCFACGRLMNQWMAWDRWRFWQVAGWFRSRECITTHLASL